MVERGVRHRGEIVFRSRDHSRVELLLHEGVINEREISTHPLRNYVECCLGGSEPVSDMSIAPCRRIERGDVVLLCSDGLWSGIADNVLFGLTAAEGTLDDALLDLAEHAVESNAPNGDNTSAVALRVNGARP